MGFKFSTYLYGLRFSSVLRRFSFAFQGPRPGRVTAMKLAAPVLHDVLALAKAAVSGAGVTGRALKLRRQGWVMRFAYAASPEPTPENLPLFLGIGFNLQDFFFFGNHRILLIVARPGAFSLFK